MNIRKFVVFVASVILFLASAGAFAQDGLVRASTNPFEGQFRIEVNDGTVVVADHASETWYISKQSGQIFEVSFADAIAHNEISPAKRQEMLNEFKAMLSDTGTLITVAPRRVATDATFWRKEIEMCGDVICISPDDASFDTGLSKSPDNALACAPPTCDPSNQFPCNFGPCSPYPWPDNRWTFYSGWGAGWGSDQGGGSTVQQQILEQDRRMWERDREGACSEKGEVAAETSAIGVITVGSCLAAKTGVGALGCAAGAVVYGLGLHKIDNLNRQCQASYPGYGNW